MQEIDLAAFRAAPLVREPFDYLVVPGFLRTGVQAALDHDFPQITRPGSFPVSELSYGPAFANFLATLNSDAMRDAFEEKFGLSLKNRPTMVTVRGQCGLRDGNIHTDSASKIITVLIYLNSHWEGTDGCLRLLRSGHDIDDVITEVPPLEGTLVAFRRSDNSWHGHKPFIGRRRVIQLNWVTGAGIMRFETLRHRATAWMKRLNLWSGERGLKGFSWASVPTDKSETKAPDSAA